MSPASWEVPRIGLGWDRHRLQVGRPCVLAGVPLESPVGPVGHSDGDAVLHALADALLGGAGADDLGTLFPDQDPRWRGTASSFFLRAALERVAAAGLRVVSADVVVVCDRPRLAPHRPALRASLARLLDLPAGQVNVKGKSREGEGGGEWIEATAVALLLPRPGGI